MCCMSLDVMHTRPFPPSFFIVQILNYIYIFLTVFPRQGEVKHIVERCMLIRAILREKLRLLGTPGRWDHLTQQGGLFCCTGLNGKNWKALFQPPPLSFFLELCFSQSRRTASASNKDNINAVWCLWLVFSALALPRFSGRSFETANWHLQHNFLMYS